MSNSLSSHGLQHARLPCPSPTPGVFPSSQWCHSTISSSVVPFSCLQSFPASGSFLMSWLLASSGQSIGALLKAASSLYTISAMPRQWACYWLKDLEACPDQLHSEARSQQVKWMKVSGLPVEGRILCSHNFSPCLFYRKLRSLECWV